MHNTSKMNNYHHEIGELWSKLSSKLKLFIRSKIHDDAIADDILQDVFVKIHMHIDKLNDKTKVQSWIYQN